MAVFSHSSAASLPNRFRNAPDENGFFGNFGGCFVAETLMPCIDQVNQAWQHAKHDNQFWKQFHAYLQHYVGRPSPLWHAKRLSEHCQGAQIWLKRDELNHTGAHKINNCIGQILLARRMGKTRIIAETGAGQHGVATATVCALFNIPCIVYMGSKDIERQQPNVFRMKLLGAELRAVESGSASLKDAMNEALRDWVTYVDESYYLIGTIAGPHPYPEMVREFQSIIGKETRAQLLEQAGCAPDALVAAVGGGSNAIGLFHEFLDDKTVRMFGIEAAGEGLDTQRHAAALSRGDPGILHGNRSFLLQNDDGQIQEAHSCSAGLDYPGVGPEHAWLHETGRVSYEAITDHEALNAVKTLCRTEGILPALEPAHALAFVEKLAPTMDSTQNIVVNLCGRGDKDIATIASYEKNLTPTTLAPQ